MTRSLDSALIEFGIDPLTIDLGLVDVWQRVPTNDKPRKPNGSVMVKPDGAVIIWNWGTDEKTVWQPQRGSAAIPITRRRTDPDRAKTRERQRQADAAALASDIWGRAKPAALDHPYLARKKLPPLELREADAINGWRNRWLICPLYSAEPRERIRNLECINTDGDKRPIKGALRKGVFGFAGLGMPTDEVIICEGWATAAALHVSLELPIVFSVGANNLALVAKIWRKRLPNARIIIAADDDTTGFKAAMEARTIASAELRKPEFGEASGSDFCDIYTQWGAERLRERWNSS